ncbi:MAG: hypothetical protein JJV88_05125 [Sulfurovum sp.]|nr:hypothetical protein [Sulfurovaceae bacterium]
MKEKFTEMTAIWLEDEAFIRVIDPSDIVVTTQYDDLRVLTERQIEIIEEETEFRVEAGKDLKENAGAWLLIDANAECATKHKNSNLIDFNGLNSTSVYFAEDCEDFFGISDIEDIGYNYFLRNGELVEAQETYITDVRFLGSRVEDKETIKAYVTKQGNVLEVRKSEETATSKIVENTMHWYSTDYLTSQY